MSQRKLKQKWGRQHGRIATALALVGALFASMGLVLLGPTAASANSVTCNSLGFAKFDSPSGSQSLPDSSGAVGSMAWAGKTLNYTVNAGYTVQFCIKSGSQAGTTTFTVVGPSSGSKSISQGISHVGWKLVTSGPSQPTPLIDTDEEEEMNCDQGYRSRVITTTKEYVLSNNSWVLEPQSEWFVATGEWSDWRALTTAERAQLKCDRPSPVIENLADSESSCDLGHRSRTGTLTKEYVRSGNDWILEPAGDWTTTWGAWSGYRALTNAEFEQLGCRTGQPEPVELLGSETRMDCAGVEERTSTQVTTFVWNETTRDYDKVVGDVAWSDWVKVRNLTNKELRAEGCVLGEETLVPTPKPDKKPTKAVAEPTVKGVERVPPPAAVPTAVAAGAGEASPNAMTQLLAQLLVGGGMLLLLAGGWIGFGRREGGAHAA